MSPNPTINPSKYHAMCLVLPTLVILAETQKRMNVAPAILCQFLGNPNALESNVNSHGITADGDNKRIDTKPVDVMIGEYMNFWYHDGPKPEWLAHSGF